MKISTDGFSLIKKSEGLRLNAYRDAVGVWTIGYGHTSMAGEPAVKSGMVITEKEADDILRHDVEMFAQGVAALIKTNLNDNQFSAVVSFAFNVGLGNFKKSSVLKVINDGSLDLVPRRLALWTKAGGKVLPGLVKRRASEGDLFCKPVMQEPIQLPPSKETKSSTGKIIVATGGAGAAAAASQGWHWTYIIAALVLASLVASMTIYIINKRKLT